MRQVLRSKIHRATVTDANPDYVGSITIDEDLLEAVGLWPGEKVLVASVDTGQRLETYTLKGEKGVRRDMCQWSRCKVDQARRNRYYYWV